MPFEVKSVDEIVDRIVAESEAKTGIKIPEAYIEWMKVMHTHGNGDDPGPPDLPEGFVVRKNEGEETDPRKPEQMKKQDPDEFLKRVFGPAERSEETEAQKQEREFFFPNSKDSTAIKRCECGSSALGHEVGPFHSSWCPLHRSW